MKVCSKCKIEKDEGNFYKRKNRSGELTWLAAECKTCAKIRSRQSVMNNVYKVYLIQKMWREKNADKLKKSKTRYQKINREKIKIKRKLFYEKNKERLDEANKTNQSNYRNKHKIACQQRIKKCQATQIELLQKPYLRAKLLRDGFTNKLIEKNPDILETKKLIIKIKRYVKEKTKH